MATKLLDLWHSSALIQAAMALMGFGTICYLEIVAQPPSQILAALVGSIVGFYFGQKNAVNRTTQHPYKGGSSWHE